MSSIELTTSNNYYHTFMEPPKNSPKLRMFLINVQENIYEEDKVKRFFSTTGYAILVWATSFFQTLTFSAKCFETCMFEIWYLGFSEVQERLKCNAENVALSLKYTIAMPVIIIAGMLFPDEVYSPLEFPQDAPMDIEQEYARVNQEKAAEEERANRAEGQIDVLLDDLDREMTEHHADITDRDQLQVNLNIARTVFDTLNAERDQLAWDVQIEKQRADNFEGETTRLQVELLHEAGAHQAAIDEFERDLQTERQRAGQLDIEARALRTELIEEKRVHGEDNALLEKGLKAEKQRAYQFQVGAQTLQVELTNEATAHQEGNAAVEEATQIARQLAEELTSLMDAYSQKEVELEESIKIIAELKDISFTLTDSCNRILEENRQLNVENSQLNAQNIQLQLMLQKSLEEIRGYEEALKTMNLDPGISIKGLLQGATLVLGSMLGTLLFVGANPPQRQTFFPT